MFDIAGGFIHNMPRLDGAFVYVLYAELLVCTSDWVSQVLLSGKHGKIALLRAS